MSDELTAARARMDQIIAASNEDLDDMINGLRQDLIGRDPVDVIADLCSQLPLVDPKILLGTLAMALYRLATISDGAR